MGEEGVLLRLVEAVDLVDEDDGAAALAPPALLGRAQDLAHLLDPGEDRAHRLEVGLGQAADHEGEGRLARAGRAPEDERAELVLLDRAAQGPAGAEHLLLAEDLVERARPHPVGERRVGPRLADRVRPSRPRRRAVVGEERAASPSSRGRAIASSLASRAGRRKPRCRAASKSTSAAATPTLRLSTGAASGIAQPGGGALAHGGGQARRPRCPPRAPPARAGRPRRSGARRRAAVASTATPRASSASSACSIASAADVGEAEGAAHRAAQRLPREGVGAARGQDARRVAPAASAVRSSPPRLPGFWTPSATSTSGVPPEDRAPRRTAGAAGQGEEPLRRLRLRERGEELGGHPPHRHPAAAQRGEGGAPRRATPRPAARRRPRRPRAPRRAPRATSLGPSSRHSSRRPRAP